MKTEILRNIFISVGVLFTSAQLLSAGMNDGVLNFSKAPSAPPQPTFITFDPPGGPARDMLPSGINPAGAITGTYYDANVVGHGFLRAPDGTITTFDPPGSTGPFGTGVGGNNPAGAITGNYFDVSSVFHGFLRASDGTFTTIDPPGSGATFPAVINPKGVITGEYFDATGAAHGFLRIP